MAFSIIPFLIALGIGVLIGLEREIEIQKKTISKSIGIRSFALISLFGSVAGFFAQIENGIYLSILCFVGFFALLTANYVMRTIRQSKGITTELSAILAFVLSFLIVDGHAAIAVPIAIFVLLLLTFRKPLHEFAARIHKNEVYATIKFAIIALVILPFLPNTQYSLLDIPALGKVLAQAPFADILQELAVFNPYTIWLMVVLISGISFVGYVLIKTVGEGKGLGLTGFLGGLVSSTAVTSSLSIESKRSKNIATAAAFGVVIASSTMFFRIMVEIIVVNSDLTVATWIPILGMGAIGLIGSYILWRRVRKDHKHTVDFSSPFKIGPALTFAAFFAFVLFISKLGQLTLGTQGILLAALLAGLADVDAITLSLASLALSGDITPGIATLGITIAAVTNTIVKGGIAYFFGARTYSRAVGITFAVICSFGLLSLFLVGI